jgi:hypothetical protein
MSIAEQTPLSRFIEEFRENRLAVAGACVLLAILVIALTAPWISPQNPYDLAQLDIMDAKLEPGAKLGNNRIAPLGTDEAVVNEAVVNEVADVDEDDDDDELGGAFSLPQPNVPFSMRCPISNSLS